MQRGMVTNIIWLKRDLRTVDHSTLAQIGFPFRDACMRSLCTTGWINFRMPTMLVSFASYNIRLHRQKTGLVLVGKDGGVKLTRSTPVRVSTLFSTIDAMPMRRDEIRRERLKRGQPR